MPPSGYVRRAGADGDAVVRADLADVGDEIWWGSGTELATSGGRGRVSLIQPRPGLLAVARDYHRGGALAGLLGRRFLAPGRSEQELELLVAAAAAGIPTLVPLAALTRRQGAFYELRLVTEIVAGALPLPAFAASEPRLRRAAIEAAGRVAGQAFAAGLLHADLHAENLIAREDGGRIDVRLIDLDRARLAPPLTERERDRMLLRMARHLRKHAARLPVRVTRADQLRFLRGVGCDRQQRRAAMRRLGGRGRSVPA